MNIFQRREQHTGGSINHGSRGGVRGNDTFSSNDRHVTGSQSGTIPSRPTRVLQPPASGGYVSGRPFTGAPAPLQRQLPQPQLQPQQHRHGGHDIVDNVESQQQQRAVVRTFSSSAPIRRDMYDDERDNESVQSRRNYIPTNRLATIIPSQAYDNHEMEISVGSLNCDVRSLSMEQQRQGDIRSSNNLTTTTQMIYQGNHMYPKSKFEIQHKSDNAANNSQKVNNSGGAYGAYMQTQKNRLQQKQEESHKIENNHRNLGRDNADEGNDDGIVPQPVTNNAGAYGAYAQIQMQRALQSRQQHQMSRPIDMVSPNLVSPQQQPQNQNFRRSSPTVLQSNINTNGVSARNSYSVGGSNNIVRSSQPERSYSGDIRGLQYSTNGDIHGPLPLQGNHITHARNIVQKHPDYPDESNNYDNQQWIDTNQTERGNGSYQLQETDQRNINQDSDENNSVMTGTTSFGESASVVSNENASDKNQSKTSSYLKYPVNEFDQTDNGIEEVVSNDDINTERFGRHNQLRHGFQTGHNFLRSVALDVQPALIEEDDEAESIAERHGFGRNHFNDRTTNDHCRVLLRSITPKSFHGSEEEQEAEEKYQKRIQDVTMYETETYVVDIANIIPINERSRFSTAVISEVDLSLLEIKGAKKRSHSSDNVVRNMSSKDIPDKSKTETTPEVNLYPSKRQVINVAPNVEVDLIFAKALRGATSVVGATVPNDKGSSAVVPNDKGPSAAQSAVAALDAKIQRNNAEIGGGDNVSSSASTILPRGTLPTNVNLRRNDTQVQENGQVSAFNDTSAYGNNGNSAADIPHGSFRGDTRNLANPPPPSSDQTGANRGISTSGRNTHLQQILRKQVSFRDSSNHSGEAGHGTSDTRTNTGSEQFPPPNGLQYQRQRYQQNLQYDGGLDAASTHSTVSRRFDPSSRRDSTRSFGDNSAGDNNYGYGTSCRSSMDSGSGIDGGSNHTRNSHYNDSNRDFIRGLDQFRSSRPYNVEAEYNNNRHPLNPPHPNQPRIYGNGREIGGGVIRMNGGGLNGPSRHDRSNFNGGDIGRGSNSINNGTSMRHHGARVDSDDCSVNSSYQTGNRYLDNTPGQSVMGKNHSSIYPTQDKRKYTPPSAPYSLNDRRDIYPQQQSIDQNPSQYSSFGGQSTGYSDHHEQQYSNSYGHSGVDTNSSMGGAVQHSPQIEISPGVFERLRGARETSQAVEERNISYPSCMVCSSQLVCISDAQYVLCPTCKVVSPVFDENGRAGPVGGGVGLGMLRSDLEKNSSRMNHQHQRVPPNHQHQRVPPNHQPPNSSSGGGGRPDNFDYARYYSDKN